MNRREKNLVLLVVVVGSVFGYSQFKGRLLKQVRFMEKRTKHVQKELEKRRAMLPVPVQIKGAPPVSNVATLEILRDLTSPVEIRGLRVVNLDRPSPRNFRLTVSGKFHNMMRFLGYMERTTGKFSVFRLEFRRRSGPNSESREIEGTFHVNSKG